MLWFFHNRVFPRPGNRTGDQATGIFLSLSEQESHFKSSPFSLPKSIIPDVCLNRNLRTNSNTHTQSYLLWYITISHVHMRFRIGDSSNVRHIFEAWKFLWYPFFQWLRPRYVLPLWFSRYSVRIRFGYYFVITTQKGESKSRICPFYLPEAILFGTPIWQFPHNEIGCMYQFDICNNFIELENFVNISQLGIIQFHPIHHIIYNTSSI